MGSNLRQHLALFLITLLSIKLTDGDGVRFGDDNEQPAQNIVQPQQQQQPQFPQVEERRQGKHLLDLVGLGTGSNVDPYLARVNSQCLSGELADCFKSQALGTFNEFFSKDYYKLSSHARIIRMPENQLRSLAHEPYEFVSESRAEDSDWDQLVKFAMRRVEKFLKSTAFEIEIPEDVSDGGRYSPRFIEEITDEIDVLEDKKAPIFTRNRFKKLFIPLLIILKLFKLKLLLFLPLILGLASFKKLLGFLALVIPGVIGYFKLCGGQNNLGPSYNQGQYFKYSPQGLGSANYHQHYSAASNQNQYYKHPQPSSFSDPYSNYYRESAPTDINSADSVRFGDDSHNNNAHNLAYQGYSEYRNKKTETES